MKEKTKYHLLIESITKIDIVRWLKASMIGFAISLILRMTGIDFLFWHVLVIMILVMLPIAIYWNISDRKNWKE